jgi:hypothetical protein
LFDLSSLLATSELDHAIAQSLVLTVEGLRVNSSYNGVEDRQVENPCVQDNVGSPKIDEILFRIVLQEDGSVVVHVKPILVAFQRVGRFLRDPCGPIFQIERLLEILPTVPYGLWGPEKS